MWLASYRHILRAPAWSDAWPIRSTSRWLEMGFK